jgi:proteasome beta subunit
MLDDTTPDASGGSPADANVTKTGTTTVALAAADRVVMAADRRASLGGRVVSNKDTEKIAAVHPTAGVAIAGAVGNLQWFLRHLRSEASLYRTRRGEPTSIPALATLAGTMLRAGPYRAAQPTLGGVDSDGAHVFELDAGGGVLSTEYAAAGSGMQFAYGLLEDRYRPGLTGEEATAVAAEAVATAIERDTASGNGVTVAEVTADGVEIAGYGDPAEVA